MKISVTAALVLVTTSLLVAEEPKPIAYPIRYELKKTASVSVGVYDHNERQVRALTYGVSQQAGPQELVWDGVDTAGMPVPAGTYHWKMLATAGFTATYLTTIGTNPGGPTYTPWLGNHEGPRTVAVTAQGIVVGGGGENAASYACTTLDGSKITWWAGQHVVAASPVSLASTKNALIDMVFTNWGGKPQALVFLVNPETGGELSHFDVLAKGDAAPDYRMDANDTEIVVTYATFNEVRWFDHAGKQTAVASIPNPGDVVLTNTGITQVLSGGQLVTLERTGKTTVMIAKNELDSPVRVALERTTGALWLVEAGSSQQVKRFSALGKREQVYGRKGGRQYGDYRGQDFLNITDLSADGVGGFVVTEGSGTLCRTARINAAGAIVREWFGPQQFYNFTRLDPRRLDEAWFYGGYNDAAVAKVDWKTGNWQVIRTFNYPTADGLFPQPTSNHGRYVPYSVGDNGYVRWEGNDGPVILRIDEKVGKLIPVAAARMWCTGAGPTAWQEAMKKAGRTAGDRGGFTWSDRNGDGDFQADEFVIGGTLPMPGFWSQTAMAADRRLVLPASGTVPWNELLNLGTSEVPRWDLTQLLPTEARYPADMRYFVGGASPMGSYVDAQKNVYLLVVSNCAHDTDKHEGGWPDDYQGTARFVKWDREGKPVWSIGKQAVPHSAVDPLIYPVWNGEFHRAVRIVGEIRDCLIVAEQIIRPASVWTKDGLYVGNFLDHRANDGLPGHLYNWYCDPVTRVEGPIPWDCLAGGSVNTLADGRVVWMPMGTQNTPVYTISGWDDWVRREGELKVVAAIAPPAAGKGLIGRYHANATLTGEPTLIRPEARLWFGPFENSEMHSRSWAQGPVPGIAAGADFSARWSGFLRAPFTEAYRFRMRSDANSRYRVWCDGVVILDTWDAGSAPSVTESEPQRLRAGQFYTLEVEYAHHGPDAAISLVWESPTLDRQRIPQEYLYATDGQPGCGLRADYLRGDQNVFTCVEATPLFDARASGATAVRWSGYLLPPAGDAGAECVLSTLGSGAVTIHVEDRIVLEAPRAGGAASKPFTLTANQPARVTISYTGKDPAFRVQWSLSKAPAAPLPASALRPAVITKGTGLTAEYFSDAALTAIIDVQQIPQIDVAWTPQSLKGFNGRPVSGLALHGTLTPPHAAGVKRYTLRVVARGQVELELDGKAVPLKASKGSVDSTVALELLAGRALPMHLRFKAADATSSLRLSWSADGMPDALVPLTAFHPLPSLLSDDLLAGLPLSGELKDGGGNWSTSVANGALGWRASLSRHGAAPVLSCALGTVGEVNLKRPLNAGGKPLAAWAFSAQISYPGNYNNHYGEGQYLTIHDAAGKAIVQLKPQQVNWPDDQQIIFNNVTLRSCHDKEFKASYDWNQALRIEVRDAKATVTLGDLPPQTIPILDATADWQRPASLTLTFTQGGAVYNRVVQLESPRFFPLTTTPTP